MELDPFKIHMVLLNHVFLLIIYVMNSTDITKISNMLVMMKVVHNSFLLVSFLYITHPNHTLSTPMQTGPLMNVVLAILLLRSMGKKFYYKC